MHMLKNKIKNFKSKNLTIAYAFHESHQVLKILTSKVLGPQQGGFHNRIAGTCCRHILFPWLDPTYIALQGKV
jgi:hypothetical protein